jgi:hypothetical protein
MNLIRELVTIAPDCECIKVTYTLEGEEPVTVEVESDGTENGKNYYLLSMYIESQEQIIYFKLLSNGEDFWLLNITNEGYDPYSGTNLSSSENCPFGVYSNGDYFEAFEVEPCY